MSGTRDNRRLIFGALAGLVCALVLVGSMVTQAAAAPHAGTTAPPVVANGAGQTGKGNSLGVSMQAKPGSAPDVADAYAHLVPGPVVTVTLGTSFTLDLKIFSGSNTVVGQQSYLTFTNSLLQAVDPQQPGCVSATTVTEDPSRFPVALQDVVDNSTGEIGYASGTFSGGVGPGTDFRVASITFCANAAGDAVIHWQFSPPDPINRSSKITNNTSSEVENRALYTDVLVHIIAPPTATPTVTSTPTATATPTATSTWVQWTATPTPNPFGAALAAPGLYFNGGSSQVFAGGANGVKAAFDGATGNQLWSVSVGGAVYNRGPIVPIGGTNVVIFTSGDGYVNALRAADGTAFWPGGGTQIGSSAAAGPAYGPGQGASGEDLVFAGTNENSTNNKFVALNAATGAQVWSFSGTLGPVTTPPAVDLANHRVFFGSANASGSGGGLWALDTRTGTLLWGPLTFGPDTTSFPTLSNDGSTVYAALGTSPSLYALNTTDGTLKNGWTPFSAGGASFLGAPWLDGSYIYTTAGNSLYALDLTGALKPGWTTPNVPGAGTPLVLSDSHQAIYVGGSSGLFYKLNLSDGSPAHAPLDLGTGATVSNATYDVVRNAFYIMSGGRLFSIAGNW